MFYTKVSKNVKIAVEDLLPKKFNGQTLLFLHGWPLNHKMFEYQTNWLPSEGFRCISIDIRGFGESETTTSGYSYDQLADDVYQLILSMRLANVTLVGFSMGGAIAIRYIANYNNFRIGKLALLAAAAPSFTKREDYPFGMTKKEVNALIEQTYDDRPKMITEFGEKFFGQKPSDAFLTWFNNIAFSTSGIGTIEAAYSLRDEDLRNDLCKIQVNTGIFHGLKDQICPYSFAHNLHKSIKQSELFTFENSGHAVFYDELHQFNKTFLNFLIS